MIRTRKICPLPPFYLLSTFFFIFPFSLSLSTNFKLEKNNDSYFVHHTKKKKRDMHYALYTVLYPHTLVIYIPYLFPIFFTNIFFSSVYSTILSQKTVVTLYINNKEDDTNDLF